MSATSEYREWRPAPELRTHVACTWLSRIAPGEAARTHRVLPDGCIDLIWDGKRLYLAGPDTGSVLLNVSPGSAYVGLRLRPGMGGALLHMPLNELRDSRVNALDVLGARAVALSNHLEAGLPGEMSVHLLHRAVQSWLPSADAVDARIAAVVARLRDPSAPSIARLAAEVNLSERQLHRRCVAAVGYGPKVLQRIFRLKRFLALARAKPGLSLAALASEAGYVDQAHMNRDCQDLGGATPKELLPCALTAA